MRDALLTSYSVLFMHKQYLQMPRTALTQNYTRYATRRTHAPGTWYVGIYPNLREGTYEDKNYSSYKLQEVKSAEPKQKIWIESW